MPLALSTGHEVGLAVTAAAFIVFALASSFLFPRIRPQFPGSGLVAFIVVAVVFFFGMLSAVEVFGAEGGKSEATHTETGGQPPTTVQRTTTAQQQQQTTTSSQTTTRVTLASQINVSETEFKIAMPSTLSAGNYIFDVKDNGKIAHDLSIKGGSKTKLIQPGGTAELRVKLAKGKYHFYCSVPGHEAAGMKIDVTVS